VDRVGMVRSYATVLHHSIVVIAVSKDCELHAHDCVVSRLCLNNFHRPGS
jgi:hypothetical protein